MSLMEVFIRAVSAPFFLIISEWSDISTSNGMEWNNAQFSWQLFSLCVRTNSVNKTLEKLMKMLIQGMYFTKRPQQMVGQTSFKGKMRKKIRVKKLLKLAINLTYGNTVILSHSLHRIFGWCFAILQHVTKLLIYVFSLTHR